MAKRELPSQEVLRQLVDYGPDTGHFTWLSRPEDFFDDGKQTKKHNAAIWNGKNAGKPAFVTPMGYGYLSAGIFGQTVLAHRAAWKWMTGEEAAVIDHIDGDPKNNKWSNLRSVCQQDNSKNARRSKNNTSGAVGVVWNKQRSRWCASIHINYRKKHLGLFDKFEDAVAARKAAELEHGFHENHGRAA